MVGVLQVYDPDRWMPRELSFIFSQNRNALASATYVGANGRVIIRPPGLFDSPGAVCGPGTVAALLGSHLRDATPGVVEASCRFGVLGRRTGGDLSEPCPRQPGHHRRDDDGVRRAARRAARAAAGGRVRDHVRLGSCCGISGFFDARRRIHRAAILDVAGRGSRSLYYASRGAQLSSGFSEFLAQYPLGAGLARWGMMNVYFGDPANLDAPPLWAEIQPNAWVLDGGVIFIALYVAALLGVARSQWRLFRQLPELMIGCGRRRSLRSISAPSRSFSASCRSPPRSDCSSGSSKARCTARCFAVCTRTYDAVAAGRRRPDPTRRHGCREPCIGPTPGASRRRGSRRHASRLAGPSQLALAERARGLAPVRPPHAGRPHARARGPSGVAAFAGARRTRGGQWRQLPHDGRELGALRPRRL